MNDEAPVVNPYMHPLHVEGKDGSNIVIPVNGRLDPSVIPAETVAKFRAMQQAAKEVEAANVEEPVTPPASISVTPPKKETK
jgi:hypothetical protein